MMGDFEQLVQLAQRYSREGNAGTAAVYGQMAADQASWHHTGTWVSPELESMLAEIGHDLGTASDRRRDDISGPRRILHVLTQALALGGHTRMVWRWIENDRHRAHSAVITLQGAKPVPQELSAAVAGAGGQVTLLDRQHTNLIQKAQALSRLASQFDQVVLHVHPFDVVPSLAFASGNRPPVMYVNHADHGFWIGAGVSDVIAHLRESGVGVSCQRRGVDRKRCVILPTPLVPRTRIISKAEAKSRLGLPPDSVVLLSVATPYKYKPMTGQIAFPELVLPILNQHPNAFMLMVGPGHEIQHLCPPGESRMRVYGKRGDTALFYQAADIYLDSYPFASTTSVLEAGMHSIPLAGFCPELETAPLLYSDCPGTTSTMIRKIGLEDFRAAVSELILSESMRTSLGESTREGIVKAHSGEGWNDFLENAYCLARSLPPADAQSLSPVPQMMNTLDLRMASLHAHPGMHRGIKDVVGTHQHLLPLGKRIGAWRKFHGASARVLPRVLIPARTKTALRQFRFRLNAEALKTAQNRARENTSSLRSIQEQL